ncbi:MAG: acyl-CoA dehydrogenase, partial [Cyanobacteria bacterium J06600_6]
LPFENTTQSVGQISFSQPMELLAVTATNTVSAKLDRWYLSAAEVVSINPPNSIHQSSRKNILNHGFYALGCAYAGLDILENIAQKKQLDFVHSSFKCLQQEVKTIEQQALNFITNPDTAYEQKLQLRSQAIALAQRCSLAAVTASSGAANYLYSSVGRVYREALLFTVSGQTIDVMAASLKSLIRDS